MVRQAFSLDVLLAEVNRHATNRNKASDGGLGDAAHQAQGSASDHNPNALGVWRAYDFTNDPAHLPGQDLAARLATRIGKMPAMMSGAYIIWNRHIISFNHISEGWRVYTGPDPHTSHVHLSVATVPSGYDNREAWNLWAVPQNTRPYPRARGLVDDAIHLIESQVPPNRAEAHAYGDALRALQRDPRFPTN